MPDVSIVRDQACPLPEKSDEIRSSFRILGAAAHPKLTDQIEVAKERQLLEAALRNARGVTLQWVDGGLLPGRSVDHQAQMFHFAGHGAFEFASDTPQGTRDVGLLEGQSEQPDGPGAGLLIFDDGTGGADRVPAGKLGVILRDLGVRVAILNACRSARRDPVNAWSSVAAALLRAGVHSVVAMQHTILDASAVAFAAAFYERLAISGCLDEAAHAGRLAVFQHDTFGWGTPVLYVPDKFDGVIFFRAPRRSAHIDFSIERQRHEDFVGRAALLDKLDQLLVLDRVDRWVVVSGGPGVGKSALLATWLARREAAGDLLPHHFIRRGEYDWDDPAKLVGSLVAQLEQRFPRQSEGADDARMHPAARLLAMLMRVSSNELLNGERLVILIDGLDEYDPPPGSPAVDPLAAFLPHALPRGVRFLCASRPRHPYLSMIEARDGAHASIDLDAPDYAADNTATVHAFWTHAAPPLELDAQFIDEAVTCAAGNLQHAVMLRKHLAMLPADQRSVERVPAGLHALLVKMWERVAAITLAVHGLGILCAARGALTLDELGVIAGWTGATWRQEFVHAVREFVVATRRADNQLAYRLHHDSIREQITSMLGATALRKHHAELAHKLANWPPATDPTIRRYALHHALSHRAEAGDWADAWRIVGDLSFLEAKCREIGVHEATIDVEQMAERCRASNDEVIAKPRRCRDGTGTRGAPAATRPGRNRGAGVESTATVGLGYARSRRASASPGRSCVSARTAGVDARERRAYAPRRTSQALG